MNNFTSLSPDKEEFGKSKSWGLSAMIDLYQCKKELITSPEQIEKFVEELCELIDMKCYGKALIERFGKDYYEGVSLMQFIETSSITAHFDEQENRAFIDIFSCKHFIPQQAADFSQRFFEAKNHKLNVLLRK